MVVIFYLWKTILDLSPFPYQFLSPADEDHDDGPDGGPDGDMDGYYNQPHGPYVDTSRSACCMGTGCFKCTLHQSPYTRQLACH